MKPPARNIPVRSITVEQFIDQFLSAVCDSRRRHILASLTASADQEPSPTERSVGEIAAHLGLAMSTISEHLKQVLQMHLLLARKEGKKTLYRLRNRELVRAFHDLIVSLEEHYHHIILSFVDRQTQEADGDMEPYLSLAISVSGTKTVREKPERTCQCYTKDSSCVLWIGPSIQDHQCLWHASPVGKESTGDHMTEWIGQRLGGYLLEEELGREATGILFRGRQLALGREVAIEMLPRHLSHDPAAVARFLRQARIMAQLNHPNILQIYDADQHDDLLYLVFEYVPGPTIRSLLGLDGRLPQQQAAAYAAQAADALEAAYHECRVIHCHLTPEHLVLDWRGQLKVTGFGLARAHGLPLMGTETGMVERLAYASPEQVWGQPPDHRSDLYALGVVLYEMVTGTLPFAGHTLRDLAQAITAGRLIPLTEKVPGVSRELEYIMLTALATNPDERFAHAGLMADALRAFPFHTLSIDPASQVQGAHTFVEDEHHSRPLIKRQLTLPMRAPHPSIPADRALSEEDTVKRPASQQQVHRRQSRRQGNSEQSA